MPTYYTFIGAFQALRKQMNKEFKRVGINTIKEKRWFLQDVLGNTPYLSDMTINEMETVVQSLQPLPDNYFLKERQECLNRG